MNEISAGLYLEHMLGAALRVRAFSAGMSQAEFLADGKTHDAAIHNLQIIGEAASRLLQHHPDLAKQHSTVEWRSMRNMRNRLVHGYFDIDLEIVWRTVDVEIPKLIEALAAIIQDQASDDKSP